MFGDSFFIVRRPKALNFSIPMNNKPRHIALKTIFEKGEKRP
jgi:hypothetical protein